MYQKNCQELCLAILNSALRDARNKQFRQEVFLFTGRPVFDLYCQIAEEEPEKTKRIIQSQKIRNSIKIPVTAVSKDVIKSFESLSDASEFTKDSIQTITRALRKKRRTANGYKYMRR